MKLSPRELFDNAVPWDELLRQVGDSLPAMIWTCGPDGQCRSVNQRYLDFTGRTLDQALGEGWKEAIHPDDAEWCLAARKTALAAHQPYQLEYRLRRADGQYRWMLNQAAPQFTSTGGFLGYAGHMLDITDRKRAEDELRWMFQAVEQSPASVIITDLHGNIEYVNPKFTALTGYTCEEVMGKTPRILKSGETPAEAYRELWQTIQTGEWRGEFHNKKKNGELYWESASISPIRDHAGKPTHYIAVKEEITECKRIEAALRASEERFRIAARNASDCIYDWDLRTDTVRVWTPDGDSHQVHSYADCKRRLHPEDYDRVTEGVRRCVESRRPYRDEYRVMAPDGAVLHYADCAEPLSDETGQPYRWIGVVRDITARKQAEQVLARLAAIVQCSNDAILALDPQGRIVSWNPAAEKLYGYREAEILGCSLSNLITTDRREPASAIVAAVLRGETPPPYEVLHVRRNGSLVPVSVTPSPMRNGAGQIIGVSAIIRDISQQRRAQEALQESENRFRALIQKSSDAITLLDAGGQVLYDNGGLSRILGAPPEEHVGRCLLEWIHPEDLPDARTLLQELRQAPNTQARQQLRLRHADGSWRWCDVSGANLLAEPGVHALVASARDITDQKKMEEALRASEQKYRNLVEDASDTILTIDLQGRLTSVNRAGEKITGYRREEIVGMALRELVAPESLALIQGAIAARLGGGPATTRELEIIARDGCRIPLEVRGEVLFEDGVPVGIQAIARDIRQRRRDEQLQRDRRQVLEMVAQNQPQQTVLRRLVEMTECYFPATEACVSLPGACDPPAQARAASGGLAVPILAASGAFLGALEIYCQPRTISDSELDFLEVVSRLAALAIEHRQLSDRLAHHAQHDSLTGLPNRALLEDRLRQALALARRQQTMVAVIYVDLDRFKLVNDTLGHAVGDALLAEVAKRLQSAVRASDTLARMGGDEFVAVLFGFQNPEAAEVVGEGLVEAMRLPFQVNGNELYLSVSAGLSLFPRDGEDPAGLLKKADMAMYAVKNHGKNRFQKFSPAMLPAIGERLEIEGPLHRAIDQQELLLYYQPQFQLASGKLAGMEALLRWEHPKWGHLLPDRFIPMAEECGLIIPIGAWVLHQACRQHRLWRDAGRPPVKIAVNVSALQFACSNLAGTVGAALEKYGVEAHYLELELTEGVLMRDIADSARQIADLRNLGVRISIDDFGMGYSSLSYLQRLPIDDLKIDQCFVQGIGQPDNTAPLVEAVIGLAHGLKMTATAEGVETQAQLETLRSLGCDQAQGFLLGRPVPPAQLEL